MSLEDFIFSIVCDIWCVLFFFFKLKELYLLVSIFIIKK